MKRIVSVVLVFSLLLSFGTSAEVMDELEDMLAKGAQYAEQADYDSAGICYDIAMKLSPDDPMVLSAAAMMYVRMEDYEKALALIEDAIELTPADGSLYLVKARILFLSGRIDEANLAVQYARVCGAEMDDSLRVAAAVAYADHGDFAQAVGMFEQAEQALWWEDYSELYGQVLVRSGARDRAQQLGLIAVAAKDEALAAAIQSGQNVTLSACSEDILDLPLFCSAAYYEENKEGLKAGVIGEVTADGLRMKIKDWVVGKEFGDIKLQAVSPSGEISLYGTEGSLILSKNGEATVVMPNFSRGVSRGAQDEEYASLTYQLCFRSAGRLEQDSIVWSPDERYFALSFPNLALMTMNFIDLMLVDTYTGDLFVVEATPKKMSEEGGQTALYACFDALGENVYYLVFGDIGTNSRCGIKKYNIAENTVELLCEIGDTLVDRPNIYMDSNGKLRGITEVIRANEHAGGIVFAQEDGEWTYAIREFSNSRQTQLPVRYLYSDNSSVELILNRIESEEFPGMYLTFSADAQNSPADNQALMLAVDRNTAELIEVDEAFIAAYRENAYARAEGADVLHWLHVMNAVLSPDGYYALILAEFQSELGLYILDVQSLDYIELDVPEEANLRAAMYNRSPTSSARLDWISNDRILIPASDGNLLCRMEIG